jgi:hypothetical protein
MRFPFAFLRDGERYRDVSSIDAPQSKPRPETLALLTISNAFLATVSRIGLSRRLFRFGCCCPTSTKKSRGAIPPLSGRLVQPREVSQATKATSLVGMASLFDLDGLVGEHRVLVFEPFVQHRPSTYGILSVIDSITTPAPMPE